MNEENAKPVCQYCKHDGHKGYVAKFANGDLLFSQCDCGCKVIHGVNMQQSKQAIKKLYKQLKKQLRKA